MAKEKKILLLSSSSIDNDGKHFLQAIGAQEESKSIHVERDEITYQKTIEKLDQYLKTRNLVK